MKIILNFTILFLIFINCCGNDKNLHTISLAGISEAKQIIGYLGKPLGTVMKVNGIVNFVPVPDKKDPHPLGGIKKYLSVTHVDGVKLLSPIKLELSPVRKEEKVPLKHNEKVVVLAYERFMASGYPPADRKPVLVRRPPDYRLTLRGRPRQPYRLYKYIKIIRKIGEKIPSSSGKSKTGIRLRYD